MKTVSRKNASEQGLKRYFTGVPCKHGHVDQRLVSNGRCLACDRVSKAELLRDKPELLHSRKAADYWKNPKKHRLKARAYRQQNAAEISAREKERIAIDPERKRKKDQKHYFKYRDKKLERLARYKAENPHIFRAGEARRRARERKAVPLWFSEFDDFVWKEAAHLVLLRGLTTGIRWEADHMIALGCRQACGLHTWNNCQVIPETLNQRKKNKLLLIESLEWLRHL